jgi:hypothetical protein
MRDTSIEAYRNLLSSGDLSRQLNEAYQVIYKQGPVTGQELTKIMEEDGKWKLLAPLKHMGLVEEISKRKCLITGRVVYEWDITGKFEITVERKMSSNQKLKIAERFIQVKGMNEEYQNALKHS